MIPKTSVHTYLGTHHKLDTPAASDPELSIPALLITYLSCSLFSVGTDHIFIYEKLLRITEG